MKAGLDPATHHTMQAHEKTYQTAAQHARSARDELEALEDKSVGDWLSIAGLAIIEGYLSDNHDSTGDTQ